MTTQPWTPEQALAMFKDWNDPDLTMHEFCEKWYVAYNPDDFARIAIEALESATAEIERLKAEATAHMSNSLEWKGQRDEARAEVERLKAELAKAQHTGKGEVVRYVLADKQQQPEQCGAWGGCTLPKGHNMGRADIPENHHRPVAVPSDEEIREDLSRCYQDDRCSRPVYRALLGIAQRIGVQP